MNTPPLPKLTHEEMEASIAANRFMHLLHHPEEQDRDGDQTGPTQHGAASDLTGTSSTPPLKIVTDAESTTTPKLPGPDRVLSREKIRKMTPWMKTPSQIHNE